MNRVGFIGTVLIVLALLASTMFVVDQRQFGVVYAAGSDQEGDHRTGAELQAAAAVPERFYIDKRLLTLDSMDTEPMLTPRSSAW
jgi:membrane protease subunit HflC